MRMRKLGAALLIFVLLITLAQKVSANGDSTKVQWLTWQEAMESYQKEPRKIIVDVYTDWCGWCKRMDANTFTDPQVAQYLNENFYPVKFNAEQKEDIEYKGHTLKYRPAGNRGVHELAYSLLDGRLGYPAFVYLDESQNRITISPGYKAADAMLKELKYIGGEHYKDTPFEDFTGK